MPTALVYRSISRKQQPGFKKQPNKDMSMHKKCSAQTTLQGKVYNGITRKPTFGLTLLVPARPVKLWLVRELRNETPQPFTYRLLIYPASRNGRGNGFR